MSWIKPSPSFQNFRQAKLELDQYFIEPSWAWQGSARFGWFAPLIKTHMYNKESPDNKGVQLLMRGNIQKWILLVQNLPSSKATDSANSETSHPNLYSGKNCRKIMRKKNQVNKKTHGGRNQQWQEQEHQMRSFQTKEKKMFANSSGYINSSYYSIIIEMHIYKLLQPAYQRKEVEETLPNLLQRQKYNFRVLVHVK